MDTLYRLVESPSASRMRSSRLMSPYRAAVAVPVQLLERLVAAELQQDAVVGPAQPQLAADVLPLLEVRAADVEGVQQLVPPSGREHVEALECPRQGPGRHDVRVGVVVQPRLVPARERVVVLVGSHHAADVEAVVGRVVRGEVGPEPRDRQDQFRAVLGQEVDVPGRLVVAPGVVGDRESDVPLQPGVVGQPAARPRVEVQGLRLLAPGGPALPREHGAPVPGGPRGRPRLGEPAPPVQQHRPGHVRQPQVQEGQDEHLVPEHVAAVGLAVQAAGRDADVEVDAVRGHGLQQVEDVQAEDQRGPDGPLDLHVAAVPEVVPRQLVAGQDVVEPARAVELVAGRLPGFADTGVAGRAEGHELLHGDRPARGHRERQVDRGEPGPAADSPATGSTAPSARTRCRAARATRILDWPVSTASVRTPSHSAARAGDRWRPSRPRYRATPSLVDPSVQARADRERPRPVLRDEGALHRGQAGVAHGHQPALGDARPPSLGVLDPEPAGEDARAGDRAPARSRTR